MYNSNIHAYRTLNKNAKIEISQQNAYSLHKVYVDFDSCSFTIDITDSFIGFTIITF